MNLDRHPNPMILGALCSAVIDAGAELYRQEAGELEHAATYDRLAIAANTRGLEYRQNLALAIYLAGNGPMRSSRAFDNCFENNDGDQVVAFLVAQSRRNSGLERSIAQDFGGTFPAKWIATAERVAHGQQQELFA